MASPITAPLPEAEEPQVEEAQEMQKEFPENLKGALKKLRDICELEDSAVREVQLRKWTRLEYYFNNLIGIFWDGQIGNWRVPDWDQLQEDNDTPPRIIAIYRAHAEAIIAALSVATPSVVFFPDNADDPLDIETAEECASIAELIQRHIDAPVLFMKALTIMFNQGTIFAYNYYKRDSKFGQLVKPVISSFTVPYFYQSCPQCGYDEGESFEPIQEPIRCAQCGAIALPTNEPSQQNIQQQTGIQKLDKGRVLVDIYDPRFVKVSFYSRSQDHIGYLHLSFDQNVALLREVFNDLEIRARNTDSTYNNWARYATNYLGALPDNTAIVRCCWYRPWQFNALGEGMLAEVQELKHRFPDGCYVIFVNDEFMEAVNESLDEHWTISANPLSHYIHAEPLGTNLAVIQDIRAEIDDLKLQTVEHGIAETFVDPLVLDLDEYRKVAASPGMITPTKTPIEGQPLGNSFYQTKTATLSPELDTYEKGLDADAQFVTGSFPSVYGGPGEGGKTAAEYRMSRAQALQRLGIPWRVVSKFWCDVIRNSTFEFIRFMDDEEHFTVKKGGQMKSISIAASRLRGNIGHVEPEFSDQLPITWDQINTTLSQLMQLKDPAISATLFHPENSELVKKAIGLHDLYIPGENDRNKQYGEFLVLSQTAPIQNPQTGQLEPSVMPDAADDHPVQAQVLKSILVSSKGIHLKQNFPEGYQNCVLHMQAHLAMIPPAPPETAQHSRIS